MPSGEGSHMQWTQAVAVQDVCDLRGVDQDYLRLVEMINRDVFCLLLLTGEFVLCVPFSGKFARYLFRIVM